MAVLKEIMILFSFFEHFAKQNIFFKSLFSIDH